MNTIIYTNASGRVSVCTPTGEIAIDQVRRNDIPEGVESYVVTIDSLPQDSDDFFDAWEQLQGVVTVNLAKAKELTKCRLRFDRAPLLAAQDIAFQRALEEGTSTIEIVSEKQRLRAVTDLVDACATLQELRSLTVAKS